MASTEISALPNKVSQKNNVVMKVTDKVEQNVNNTMQRLSYRVKSRIYSSNSSRATTGSGGTSLPSRDIPINNQKIVQDEQIKPNFVPQSENNYIEEESTTMEKMLQENYEKTASR